VKYSNYYNDPFIQIVYLRVAFYSIIVSLTKNLRRVDLARP